MTGPGDSGRHGGIVAALPGYPYDVMMTRPLPDDLTASSAARGMLRSWLTDWELTDSLDDAELVVGELVANALRHGAGPITLCVGRSDRQLVLAVEDAASASLPTPRAADPDATNGRGMLLIGALAQRWGCTTGPTSKVVWAELAV